MSLTLLLLLVLLLGIVFALLRSPRNGNGRASRDDNPTLVADRVLAERFARGDIDEVEYRHRLTVLHEH